MNVDVSCPRCGGSFAVIPEHVGRTGKCPMCRERITVPDPNPAVGAGPRVKTRFGPKPEPIAAPTPEPEADAEELEGYGLASEAVNKTAARIKAARMASSGRVIESKVTPTKATRKPAEILAAFRGEIPRVRPTPIYRMWIVIIAVVMMLLPALYVGLIGLVGYGVFWHVTHNYTIFSQMGHGRHNAKAAAFVYAAPVVLGGAMIAFMLKPLFARPAKRPKVRRIDPKEEPLIAAFVDGVCASVGAPSPSRIEVSSDVNASAHLASWALSPSRELVLTIGLPLVAGLTLREFTGVLAHEFGHFSQGAGMRLRVMIGTINRWFARVVYERDSWDQALIDHSSHDNGFVIVVAYLARGAVWLVRRILWCFMWVGAAVSSALSRQQEYDADRYEARMVGGDTFASTMGRIRVLGVATQFAHGELAQNWRERRLPDDLARLTIIKASELPESLVEELRAASATEKTGLFDSHPCGAERIARANAEATDGIFHLGGPATDLFRDFDKLSRDATFDYYRSMLGSEVSKEQLFPIEEAVLNQHVAREGGEAMGRFFLGALSPLDLLPIPPEYPQAPGDPRLAKRKLGDLRREMLATAGTVREVSKAWSGRHQQAAQAEAAEALMRAGRPINAGTFGLRFANLAAAEASRAEAEAALDQIFREGEPFCRAAADRACRAIGLLELDIVVKRVPDGEILREEARALWPSASAVASKVVDELRQLSRSVSAMNLLAEMYGKGKNPQDQSMINALLRGGQSMHGRLTTLRWRAGDGVDYPFEHAQAGVTLGRFAVPSIPPADEVRTLMDASSEAVDRMFALHLRLIGRIAAIAEAVERAIGLAPLVVDAEPVEAATA